MKLSLIFLAVLSALVICECSGYSPGDKISAEPPQTKRNELDLFTPFERINQKFKKVLQDIPAKLGKLLELMVYVVDNCLSTASGEKIVLPEELITGITDYVMDHREVIGEAFGNATTAGLCDFALFKTIHKQVWVDDPDQSLNDLVKFFWRFGFPNAYTKIKEYYTDKLKCPQEIIDMIPDGPTPPPQQSVPDRASNIRGQLLSEPSSSARAPHPFSPIIFTCEIPKLLELLLGSGLLDVVALVDTTIAEVVQKPSMHFLTGKIQEPAKGDSFRALVSLPEIRYILWSLDQLLKSIVEEIGKLIPMDIFKFIKGYLGLDLCAINVVELVVNLFELIMWGKFVPFPRYESPIDPVACIPEGSFN